MRADPNSEKLSDSIIDGREREKRFRAESEQRQAAQAAQEQHQRNRQARHEAEARRIDEQVRAQIFMRVMQAQQEKPKADVPPLSFSTERQDEQLQAEQRRGKEMLERYAQRNKPAAEKPAENTELPGFKTSEQ
jgi:hypothetical protein